MKDLKWSKTEKAVARRAFDTAYERECRALAARLQEKAADIAQPEDIWGLHHFLKERLSEIEQKYEYRYSTLIIVLAGLLREGWLSDGDLEGLAEDKINKIKYIVNL